MVVGALLIGTGVLGALTLGTPEPSEKRLVLHAPKRCGAIYVTAWREGDLRVHFDDGKLQPLTFYSKRKLPDGCTWMGTEHLRPIDDRTFAYSYTDIALDCAPHETMYIPTPRTGFVVAENP